MQPRQRDAGLACQKWQFRPQNLACGVSCRARFESTAPFGAQVRRLHRAGKLSSHLQCYVHKHQPSALINRRTRPRPLGPLWASDGELSLAADRSFVPDHASPKQGKRIAAAKPMTRDESPRRAPAHRPHPHPSISTHTRTKAVASMSLPFNQPRYDHHTLSETPVPLAQTASESTHTSTHTQPPCARPPRISAPSDLTPHTAALTAPGGIQAARLGI